MRALHWIICIVLTTTLTVSAQTLETVAPSSKHVVIDKTQQMLRAYEGDRLILESRVSTGRQGRRTPNGSYQAGVKERMHRSRLYDNAPMP
jgi:lipoprotein-anchoring transpeptidase ErfK/SrfK